MGLLLGATGIAAGTKRALVVRSVAVDRVLIISVRYGSRAMRSHQRVAGSLTGAILLRD